MGEMSLSTKIEETSKQEEAKAPEQPKNKIADKESKLVDLSNLKPAEAPKLDPVRPEEFIGSGFSAP